MGWDLYIRLFLYIILVIGIMFHNEIIIVNICGLASDTKYFLELKVINEKLYSDTNDSNILQRFETVEIADLSNDEKSNEENDRTSN